MNDLPLGEDFHFTCSYTGSDYKVEEETCTFEIVEVKITKAKDIEMYRKMKEQNYQGIAPEGWHIPSNKEWEQLLGNLSEKSNGRELRSTCFWLEPGYDSFGFFALPAGYRFDNGTFNHFGRRARFWSKDEYGKSNAFRLGLTDNSIDIEGVYRSDAISVRCVKNV